MKYEELIEKLRRLGGEEALFDLERCLEEYEKFHWGIPPKEVLVFKVKRIPKVVYVLGKLYAVIYDTIKGGDRKPTLYIHPFDSPKPYLVSDAEGRQLYIVGGRYRVEPRGIVH